MFCHFSKQKAVSEAKAKIYQKAQKQFEEGNKVIADMSISVRYRYRHSAVLIGVPARDERASRHERSYCGLKCHHSESD